jgi:PIN domain nuclease of toxin-antitoxin system
LILIDTHIFVRWISSPSVLRRAHREALQEMGQRCGVSIISCWEIAKLVQYGRLELDRPVSEWILSALARPEIELLPLTPAIVVESASLPEPFHKDPADQIIVATARVLSISLITEDRRILEYGHVPLHR